MSTDDTGFLLGLSVFETLLFEDDCVYFLEAHLARLDKGMTALRIEKPPRLDLARAVREYAAALPSGPLALRVTVTRGVPGRGASVVLGARDVVRPPSDGVKVVLAPRAKDASAALESIKSTDRVRNVLLREAAQARGAFEVLLCTTDGDVSEGTLSNVFAVVDGALVTPSLERGCLAGTMRAVIVEEMRGAGQRLEERRLEVEELHRASEVFLSNTTGRAIPVIEVEGVAPGLHGARGPIVAAVSQRIRERERAYRAAYRRAFSP